MQLAYNDYERVFMIISLLLGACFYSGVMGQMTLLVANMNIVASRHKQKKDTTMDALRYIGLGEKTQVGVRAYVRACVWGGGGLGGCGGLRMLSAVVVTTAPAKH